MTGFPANNKSYSITSRTGNNNISLINKSANIVDDERRLLLGSLFEKAVGPPSLDDKFAYPTLGELKQKNENELKHIDPQAVFEYHCDPHTGKCTINAEDFKKSVHLKALGMTRSVEMVMQTVAENQALFCAQQVGGYVLREADRTVVYVKNKSFAPSDGTRLGVVDMAATRRALLRVHYRRSPAVIIGLGVTFYVVSLAIALR